MPNNYLLNLTYGRTTYILLHINFTNFRTSRIQCLCIKRIITKSQRKKWYIVSNETFAIDLLCVKFGCGAEGTITSCTGTNPGNNSSPGHCWSHRKNSLDLASYGFHTKKFQVAFNLNGQQVLATSAPLTTQRFGTGGVFLIPGTTQPGSGRLCTQQCGHNTGSQGWKVVSQNSNGQE